MPNNRNRIDAEVRSQLPNDLNTNRELVKTSRKHRVLYQHFKKGLILLIYDELEKLRRYWSFRAQSLIQAGFQGEMSSQIKIEKNSIRLIINVTVPEEFIESSIDEILNSSEYEMKMGEYGNA